MRGKKNALFPVFVMFFLILIFPCLSQDYTLDYGIVGISGAVTETTDYSIVDLISDVGMSQEVQTGGVYTITPVVGMEEETTSASNWMLYE